MCYRWGPSPFYGEFGLTLVPRVALHPTVIAFPYQMRFISPVVIIASSAVSIASGKKKGMSTPTATTGEIWGK